MDNQARNTSQSALAALSKPGGDVDPKAAKLEEQITRHLQTQHGYQSSDPEDYIEFDMFDTPHQDALASEEARHWAERYDGGLSDSDDFSQGEGSDWLAGQTLMTSDELDKRRQAHLKQLAQLYEKQATRLQHVLQARRREYQDSMIKLQDEVNRKEAQARVKLNLTTDADEDGSIPVPANRLMQTHSVPRGLDVEDVDAIGTSPFATAAEAALYVKRLRSIETTPKAKVQAVGQSRRLQCCYCQGEDACKQATIPYSRFCLRHILFDKDQHLYRACGAVCEDGSKCTRPVRKGSLPGHCAVHTSLASFTTNPRLCARLDTAALGSRGSVLATSARVEATELEDLIMDTEEPKDQDGSVDAIKTDLLSELTPMMDTGEDQATVGGQVPTTTATSTVTTSVATAVPSTAPAASTATTTPVQQMQTTGQSQASNVATLSNAQPQQTIQQSSSAAMDQATNAMPSQTNADNSTSVAPASQALATSTPDAASSNTPSVTVPAASNSTETTS
eukprot:TRINITY_DN8617_c0_g1_i3.p1 TRINITY_DN8617_c0_g1~~TRINITY_DN8617_c0_g1_i3.p1  ORF type:complete len:557 (+),score=125.94 TRINITY_DN8617_c0_g1_i3:151-1671(+)